MRALRRAEFAATAQYATWLEIPEEEWGDTSIWRVAQLCRHAPTSNWEQLVDDKGERFFHNKATGAKVREHPVWLAHRELYANGKAALVARRASERAAAT